MRKVLEASAWEHYDRSSVSLVRAGDSTRVPLPLATSTRSPRWCASTVREWGHRLVLTASLSTSPPLRVLPSASPVREHVEFGRAVDGADAELLDVHVNTGREERSLRALAACSDQDARKGLSVRKPVTRMVPWFSVARSWACQVRPAASEGGRRTYCLPSLRTPDLPGRPAPPAPLFARVLLHIYSCVCGARVRQVGRERA